MSEPLKGKQDYGFGRIVEIGATPCNAPSLRLLCTVYGELESGESVDFWPTGPSLWKIFVCWSVACA